MKLTENIPSQPGIYIMKDKKGKIIYIGKAKNLKKRVSSYFYSSVKDIKTIHLVKRIAEIDTIVTNTEVEALILECNLIKKHKPRYNIDLKDNKSYPFLKLTIREPFPRLFKTRKKYNDGNKYFGPYPDVQVIYRNLRVLQKLFPLRTCKLNLPLKNSNFRPCLNYDIGKCLAPCANKITEFEYRSIIDEVVLFLSGKYNRLISSLENKMKEYSKELKYEEAAFIRDQIQAIKELNEKQRVYQNSDLDIDLFGVFSQDKIIFVSVLFIKEGKLLGKRSYSFKNERNISKLLNNLLKKYYSEDNDIPDVVLIPEKIQDAKPISKWLSQLKNSKVEVKVGREGNYKDLIQLACNNAKYGYLSEKKITEKELVLLELKSILKLESEPRRIEGFDIANTEGKYSVASMVSFFNGHPDKKSYRIFKIQSIDTPNDYQSLQEAVARRYSRVKKEKLQLPDLILIDGGKGQLSSAYNALQALEIDDIPIISLAKKNEEIFIPGSNKPIILPRNSYSLKLLQQVRDEAHRFGNSFHRKLRSKNTIKSIFEEIKSIGKKRRMALLKKYSSIEELTNATIEELSKVESMNIKSAQKVYEFLHPDKVEDKAGKTNVGV